MTFKQGQFLKYFWYLKHTPAIQFWVLKYSHFPQAMGSGALLLQHFRTILNVHTIILAENVGNAVPRTGRWTMPPPSPPSPLPPVVLGRRHFLLLTSRVAKYQALNLDELFPAHDEGKPDDVILVQFAGDGIWHSSPLSYQQQQKIYHSCNTSSHILHPSFLCRLQLGQLSQPIARIRRSCDTVITCFAL